MSYSHAAANLVAILALQQETAQLLHALAATDPDLACRLCEEADEATRDTR
jgi:hypothetical protein